MKITIVYWISLLVPIVPGSLLLLIKLSERRRRWPSNGIARMGKFLIIALFVWSLVFAAIQQLWYLSENCLLTLMLAAPPVTGYILWRFARFRRAQKAPAGLMHLLTGNVLVFLWLLSLIVLSLELYTRFFYDQTDSLLCTKVSQRWLQRHFQRNQAGFPDNIEYVERPAPGKRRVTLVGDSFAAGYGVNRIEDRLVGRLRAGHPQWEVHLLARPGAETSSHIQFITDYFDKGFKTDDVVLIYCLNDVGDLLGNRMVNPWNLGEWSVFAENSYFANLVYHRVLVANNPTLRIENYCRDIMAGYEGQCWKDQKQRLARLRNTVRGHGARFVAVTFPFVHAVGAEYPFQRAHDRLDEMWRELDVPHLDLLPVFRGMSVEKLTANRYDAHPSGFAHGLAADKIGRFVSDQTQPRISALDDK